MKHAVDAVLDRLMFEGYSTIKEVHLNEKGYSYCKFLHLFVVSNGHRRIDIIVSSTSWDICR